MLSFFCSTLGASHLPLRSEPDRPGRPTTDESSLRNTITLTDREKDELINVLRGKLFRGKFTLEVSDDYYLGLITKLQIETVEGIGTQIAKRGKLGRKLYIIREGSVDILDEDEQTVRVTLGKGDPIMNG